MALSQGVAQQAVLLMLALGAGMAAPASAALALGGLSEQEDTSCQSNLLFRFIRLSDYAPDVNVAAAWALEGAAARNCSHTFVRGVYGMDLGLGQQLYGSDLNFKTAQVIDFVSEGNVAAYQACLAQQHSLVSAARLGRRTAQAMAVIPASACPQDAPGSTSSTSIVGRRSSVSAGAAVMDVYALLGPVATSNDAPTATNSASKQVGKQTQSNADDVAVGKRLLSLMRAAMDQMVYALGGSTWSYYDFTSQAQQGPEYATIAGTVQFASTNLLRAYWAYLHGPPVVPQLAAASAAVATIARVQMHPVQLKVPASGYILLPGQEVASLSASAALHRRTRAVAWTQPAAV